MVALVNGKNSIYTSTFSLHYLPFTASELVMVNLLTIQIVLFLFRCWESVELP